ncbi:hypothetical protein MASR1M48_16610 [Lactococcus petauri]
MDEKSIVMSFDRALRVKKAILDKRELEQKTGMKGPRIEDALVNFCAGLCEKFCLATKRSYITRGDITRLLDYYTKQWARERENSMDFNNTWYQQREKAKALLRHHKEVGEPL